MKPAIEETIRELEHRRSVIETTINHLRLVFDETPWLPTPEEIARGAYNEATKGYPTKARKH